MLEEQALTISEQGMNIHPSEGETVTPHFRGALWKLQIGNLHIHHQQISKMCYLTNSLLKCRKEGET